jgi:hypothetical protein
MEKRPTYLKIKIRWSFFNPLGNFFLIINDDCHPERFTPPAFAICLAIAYINWIGGFMECWMTGFSGTPTLH